MGKLNFIVLATASLLAALCEGRRITFAIGFCPGGYLDEATISNGILNPINARRENLTNGEQNNGLSGGKMPPATNMTQLVSHLLVELHHNACTNYYPCTTMP
ncbi:hypothetical protein Y032_0004g1759 [Ancylostoma ceylanicum]|uniref:Transthyretin-like family protein n=1 Tax=Ancylostoma ceylanicum TaxID=53326 RepID=A0A016VTL7_9BILA|nr:hypothetical protein Y032_0004g1759 [Ancylostoma ceylanicum]